MHSKSIPKYILSSFVFLFTFLALSVSPQTQSTQAIDEEYTAQIRKYTTNDRFLIKHVDYLPYSKDVPTPLDVLGHIAGAPDILSYSHEVNKYMRALANASPRVKVFPNGISEEGREMILVVISDENTIENLEHYKKINAKLADPRTVSDQEAQQLIHESKPMYWLTGALHPGETSSPEMLIELAYRIAVDESEYIKTIRDNVIVMITPVLEVDGREKQIDLYMAKHKDPNANVPNRLIYSGKYIGHDNNRDNLSLSLSLTRNTLKTFLEYHPQVLHDLHESVAYLWTASAAGPSNAWLDPVMIDEWSEFANQEVTQLTREGVPGVWTRGYPFGWSPNFVFEIATVHNAIAKLYEVQGAGDGSTRVVTADGNRKLYCPNPPLRRMLWSLRNSVSLQQRAALISINYLARNKEKYMENFYLKSKRAVAKAVTEGPAAYLFPADDPRPGQVARLFKLMQAQGVEIHQANNDFVAESNKYPKGSYIVRMDQPYSRFADMILDIQYYSLEDPRPYDDVGWTLGAFYNVRCVRIEDTSILSVPMTLVNNNIKAVGGVKQLEGGPAKVYLINHNADNSLVTFRFKHTGLKMHAAENEFEIKGRTFSPGTFIIKTEENSENLQDTLQEAALRYGFTAYSATALPNVSTHEVAAARVALVHTWMSTQNEGWIRIALDELEVPYDYISVHDIRDESNLRSKYDVIIFGPAGGDADGILRGVTGNEPIPWKKTEITPNIGRQASTDDIRGGLEYEGLTHLRDFVKQGGVFITIGDSSLLPIHFGLTQGVSIKETPGLVALGGVYKAEIASNTSPITYGYDDELNVYFNSSSSPVFALGAFPRGRGEFGEVYAGRVSGRGKKSDSDVVQGRPKDLGKEKIEAFLKESKTEEFQRKEKSVISLRAILNFTKDMNKLLVSGGLGNGEQLGGTPTIVDSQVGKGHIIMFGFNPMWRHLTHGSFFLIFNILLHYDNLDAGK